MTEGVTAGSGDLFLTAESIGIVIAIGIAIEKASGPVEELLENIFITKARKREKYRLAIVSVNY